MLYYEVIQEIWEVDYSKFFVPIFKCKWVNNKIDVRTDKLGITLVDFQKVGYGGETFIMTHHVSQVFLCQRPYTRILVNCSSLEETNGA